MDTTLKGRRSRIFRSLLCRCIIQLDGVNMPGRRTLRDHQRQQACPCAYVEHAPDTGLHRRPGALYAGIRANLHGAAILMDGKLLECEVGLTHARMRVR
jgi:hypothetical protein